MSESQSTPQLRYKRPPVIERVLTVTADIPPEMFFGRFEAWKEIIRDQFPEYDPIKDWRLSIESSEDGTPLLTDLQPELQITHRFWRRNANRKRFLSMRVSPKQLTLNLHRDPQDAHVFEELHSELGLWLVQWMKHFEIAACSSVTLNYINLISSATTPQFITSDGRLLIGRVLNVFASVPSPHFGIIPPYDCQMGLMIDPKRPAVFALRVMGVSLPKITSPAVRVDFQAAVVKPNPCLTAAQALSEATFLHIVMRDQFESLFTDEAKQSFEPVKS